MSKLRLFFLIILIQILFFQCKTDNPVPNVYVYIYLELNNPVYNALNSPGGSIIIPNEGYKQRGVIIVRTDFESFMAYDATCTYDPEDAWGKVEIDNTGIIAYDKICNSKFSLMLDGTPMEGPATIPLKVYQVQFDPNLNTLTVRN
ncbi:MAG: hypothetical protein U0W24_07025 [Bacteroidales bacterium]